MSGFKWDLVVCELVPPEAKSFQNDVFSEEK